jgi:seryl-tRNA synthetase
MREVGERIKALEAELRVVDEETERLLLQIPNLPDPSVPPAD